MKYLSGNLRKYRLNLGMTQEEEAAALHVAPQTVSKWERGETDPDIRMLPALAHLFSVTADELLGMEEMHSMERYGAVYTEARVHLAQKDWKGAIGVYEDALRTWPGDDGLLTDLAMALALEGADLPKAAEILTQILNRNTNVKLQHTARAALCYVHQKMGAAKEALAVSRQLPHLRESRETVQENLRRECSVQELDDLIYELSVGEKPQK